MQSVHERLKGSSDGACEWGYVEGKGSKFTYELAPGAGRHIRTGTMAPAQQRLAQGRATLLLRRPRASKFTPH
jgi:hypothetical protein